VVRAHPTVPHQEISPPLQHLVDKPDVFAPLKIQKALQNGFAYGRSSSKKRSLVCAQGQLQIQGYKS
jgi:hypothetical protein